MVVRSKIKKHKNKNKKQFNFYESKKRIFKELASLDSTMIFYDTTNRLTESLKIALEIFGDRNANVSRELTKFYQESRYASLSELITYYTENPPRGELVLCISGKSNQGLDVESLKTELKILLSSNNTAKSASNLIFKKYKNQYSKREIYKLANGLK